MPTYEYACNKCKAVYDLRQGFDAELLHNCEECGKGVAKRVLHTPSVVFKGSGWYVTDSRSKSSAKSDSKLTETAAGETTSSDSGTSEATKPSESAKTETKPAASKATKKSESSAAS